MGIEYRVLGDLVVVDGDGRHHHVPGRQGQVLAALLAAHPDSVTTGRIIDEVWGEETSHYPLPGEEEKVVSLVDAFLSERAR